MVISPRMELPLFRIVRRVYLPMPSFQSLQYRLYMKRAMLLVLFIGVSAGLYFGLISEQGKKLVDSVRDLGQVSVEKNDTSENLGLSDFERFLQRASSQQLILRSTELVDDPTKEILIRLDTQQRKQRIADHLIQQVDDQRAVAVGVANKLDSLRTSLLIKFDNGLADIESIEYLKKFATLHANSDNERVDQQASLSRASVQLISELYVSDPDSFEFSDQAALEFKSICRRFRDNEFVAEQLFGLLQRIFVHSPQSEQKKFSKLFTAGYENSEVARLQKMAGEVNNRLIDSEFELVDIFDSVDSLRGEAVKKLRTQILDVFQTGFVSVAGSQRIFKSIQDIARHGDYETALELSDALQSKIAAKPALQSLNLKNNKLSMQLKLAGKQIPDNVLLEFDGSAYRFKFPAAKVKAVCFMPKEAFKNADRLLFNIMRTAGKFVARKDFSLTAVYIDYGDSPKALAEVEKMKRLISVVDFCRLDATSVEGSEFVEQLAMIDPPMLLLLNSDERIVSIDVTEKEFGDRFLKLIK